jgi:target of rapamycin complex subunit LST8
MSEHRAEHRDRDRHVRTRDEQSQRNHHQQQEEATSVVLCTSGYDHTIRYWDASTGTCYRTLQYPGSQVNALCVTPDKKYLAAVGNPHVRLFDIASPAPNPLTTYSSHTGNITSVGFHKDGKWMYTGSEDHTIKIWDLRAPGVQTEFSCGSPVNSVALHPNQSEIVAVDQSGDIRTFDLTAKKEQHVKVRPGGDVPLRSVSIASNGSTAVAANNQGDCFFWTPGAFANPETPTQPSVHAPTTDPNPTVPSRATVSISSSSTSTSTTTTTTPTDDEQTSTTTNTMANAPNPSAPSTTSSTTLPVPLTPIFPTGATTSPYNIQTLTAHPGAYILKCSISPDVNTLATTSSDHTVKLWNMGNKTLAKTLAGHQRWVWDCAFSADSQYLVTASSDHTARLWELARGEAIRHYKGHHKSVICVALNDSA